MIMANKNRKINVFTAHTQTQFAIEKNKTANAEVKLLN